MKKQFIISELEQMVDKMIYKEGIYGKSINKSDIDINCFRH